MRSDKCLGFVVNIVPLQKKTIGTSNYSFQKSAKFILLKNMMTAEALEITLAMKTDDRLPL